VVTGHFPINHHPARTAVEDLLRTLAGIEEIPKWISASITLAFVTITLLVALMVSDLGSVLHFVGGTAAAVMIFLMPGGFRV
jgi:sodium-coupled neutral amino acid transporter 7/8